MTPAADIARYRANWQGEIDSIALYQAIPALEAQPQLAEVYRRLAAAEEEHARFWEASCARLGSRHRRAAPAGGRAH